jgi:hypothetical protein
MVLMKQTVQAESPASPQRKTWTILLTAVLLLAVMSNFLQWLAGPPSAETVKQKALAECRGLAQAMVELDPKEYKDSRTDLQMLCLGNRLKQGSPS